MMLYLDAKSVYAAVTATFIKQPAERSLLSHVQYIRELLDKKIIFGLAWLDTRDMGADGLTKGAVSRDALHELMAGKMCLRHEHEQWRSKVGGGRTSNTTCLRVFFLCNPVETCEGDLGSLVVQTSQFDSKSSFGSKSLQVFQSERTALPLAKAMAASSSWIPKTEVLEEDERSIPALRDQQCQIRVIPLPSGLHPIQHPFLLLPWLRARKVDTERRRPTGNLRWKMRLILTPTQ